MSEGVFLGIMLLFMGPGLAVVTSLCLWWAHGWEHTSGITSCGVPWALATIPLIAVGVCQLLYASTFEIDPKARIVIVRTRRINGRKHGEYPLESVRFIRCWTESRGILGRWTASSGQEALFAVMPDDVALLHLESAGGSGKEIEDQIADLGKVGIPVEVRLATVMLTKALLSPP